MQVKNNNMWKRYAVSISVASVSRVVSVLHNIFWYTPEGARSALNRDYPECYSYC